MYNLAIYQILAHLSVLYVVANFNIYLFLLSIAIYFVMICVGISAGYHRMLSHKGYNAPAWFKILSLFIGTLGLNASALVWTAMHREHHAYSDKEGDPHSPSMMGFFHTYFGVITYQPKLRFARDLLRDKEVMFFHKYYFKINIAVDIVLFLISPPLVIWCHWLPAAILWHAEAAINVFAHMKRFGYRNYETDDTSRNSHVLAVLIAGEGYHNNHHQSPKNTNFAHAANEFDITSKLINIIKKD
jgi:stearoyl-CoA desaturase (delta-9 desaturase)